MKPFLFRLALVASFSCAGASVSTCGNGSWDVPSTWSTGRVPGPDDDVTIVDATVESVGSRIVKSLVVSGRSVVTFRAREDASVPSDPAKLHAAANVVRVKGELRIDDGATVYAENDPKSGVAVKFEVDAMSLATHAVLSADARGWMWYESANDPLAHLTQGDYQTRALGAGGDDKAPNAYLRGGGYGASADAKSKKYSCAYGSAEAPFLPGSPNGLYGFKISNGVRGGGTVWIECRGTFTFEGRISADGKSALYGSASGGGIWIATERLKVGPVASLSARGGDLTQGRYWSMGAGGRIAVALGFKKPALDQLARGEHPSGVSVRDTIGFCKASVRGGSRNEPKDPACGAEGTLRTLVAANAPKIAFAVPPHVYDSEDVRRPCLGAKISSTNTVDWSFDTKEFRLAVRTAPCGHLRTRKVILTGGLSGWAESGRSLLLEAVSDEGYRFERWIGRLPENCRTKNPLDLRVTEPIDIEPLFVPTVASHATLVAFVRSATRAYPKPVEIVGRPIALGVELQQPGKGIEVALEIVDGAGKTHVVKAKSEGAYTLVGLEPVQKVRLPLALAKVSIGTGAIAETVSAVYARPLGRAARHFASSESRQQPLGGTVVGEKPVKLQVPLDGGVRFVLHKSSGNAIGYEWDGKASGGGAIKVDRQEEKLLTDAFGVSKGTLFAVSDSFVSIGGLRQYVRPRLRPYRSINKMVTMGYDYLADAGQLPTASEHINDLSFDRQPDGTVRMYWDGSFVETLVPPRDRSDAKMTGITLTLGPGAEYRLKEPRAEYDADRYEVLDLGANPRAKAFAGAKFAKGTAAGMMTVGGVPLRLARPLDSGDVAICHEGFGSWALEVDEYHGRSPLDGFGAAVHFRVPAKDYVKAHVVFALDSDEKKDKVLNLRLAQYVQNGSGSNMLSDNTLDCTEGMPDGVREIGAVVKDGKEIPLYAATVALDLEPVFDLVARGQHMDFEFMGVMAGRKPDAKRESAFNVFAVTLESAPVSIDVVPAPGAPSNVFTIDEAERFLTLKLRSDREESTCRVGWKATDFETGKVVFIGGEKLGALAKGARRELRVDLTKASEVGLYLLEIFVEANGTKLFDYESRFAILPPAGRRVDKASSPYATWWLYGVTREKDEWSIGGPLMQKAGIRKTCHRNWKKAESEKYDLTFTGNVIAPSQRSFDPKTGKFRPQGDLSGEDWFVREVKGQIAAVPRVDHIMIWHESAPGSGIPEEILGLPVPATTDEDRAAGAYVNECGRIIRKHFPDLRIQIGNSSSSLGAVSKAFRGGADPQYYDSIGMETTAQGFAPERMLVWGIQSMMLAKASAAYYAKRPVPAAGCYEYVYRTECLLGEKLQAAWYMRDVLISLANRMPLISPAVLFDSRNAYYDTLWGKAGLFYRAPYGKPKLAYVAYAALTKALDGVTLIKELDTGSPSVYALYFRRLDGQYATAVWTARGEADLTFETGGAGTVIGMCGKTSKLGGLFSGKTVVASEMPSYVVTEKPVASVRIAKRTFRQCENVAKKAKEVYRFADVTSISNAPDLRVQSKGHGCLPMMRPSEHFGIKTVEDDERGRCLEVTLDTSKENVNRYYTEYTTLRLMEPVSIPGPGHRLGVWVKGNSNGGQIRFEIEDRDGETFVNYGHPTLWDFTDGQGILGINFDGWAYVSCRFGGWYDYTDEEGFSSAPWSCEQRGGPTSNRKIDFPIKFKALTVGMNREALDLTDFKKPVPSIRLAAVGVEPAQSKNE